MEIILSLIVDFIITAFSYMCVPVYLILYAKKRYGPKEAFRVALINSIIVKILLMFFSSLLGNEEINIYPAIFWGTVNYNLLKDNNQQNNKKIAKNNKGEFMEGIIEKIPNWIRYIIAIPVAILGVILAGLFLMIFVFGYATPDSLIMQAFPYFYGSFANVFVFCYVLTYVLPNYKFEITLGLSCLYVGILVMAIYMLNSFQMLYFSHIVELLLTIIACIISCYKVHETFGVSQIKRKNESF